MKTLLCISMLVMMVFQTHAEEPKCKPSEKSPVSASEFKLVEKRGNIALYERWFLYDSVTKAREIKLVFEVKAEMQSAINLLQDETRSDKWNLHSSQFRVLKEDDDQWINYVRYDLP